MERQKHGFDFENFVIKKFNLIKEAKYTAEYDAYTKNNIPVQIKLEKEGSDIELADIFRNYQKSSDFILIVGFWSGQKDNITKIYSVYFDIDYFKSNFDDELLKIFRKFLDEITNNKKDDERWKNQISDFKKRWKNKTPNFIRPRFKRDHKSQKRIQCAINNKDFLHYIAMRGEYVWE